MLSTGIRAGNRPLLRPISIRSNNLCVYKRLSVVQRPFLEHGRGNRDGPVLPEVTASATVSAAAVASGGPEDRTSPSKMAVVLNALGWFISSFLYNLESKKLLHHAGLDVEVVTTAQLLLTTVALAALRYYPIPFDWKKDLPYFGLVSIGQYGGNAFGNMSISLMSISLVNVIKGSEPLIAMILNFLIFRKTEKWQRMPPILLVILGIILCNLGDLSYSHMGLLLCTLSNVFHVIKSLYSRHYFVTQKGLSAPQLFALTTLGSVIIGLPHVFQHWDTLISLFTNMELMPLLIISSIGYFFQSWFAFALISLVSPVTYSLVSIYRRVFILVCSYLVILQWPTLLTVAGVVVSNIGLYLYSTH